MKVYQFLKYNQETEITHIKNYGNDRVIICFDFEDGIQNTSSPEKTILLKQEHRDYFASIVGKFENEIKIGVRLNARNLTELQKDIQIIKNLNIHSIFLPKIESPHEVSELTTELDNHKINYKEIIPIIESNKGLNNIQSIIEECDFNSVAFGHCDYNMSLNILPFIHQENFEYWKWINELVAKTKAKNICLINSPYLSINNGSFFCSMIEHLKILSNNNFGQITLTNAQTDLCLTHAKCELEFKQLLSNRHALYPTSEYIESTIHDYEKFNTGRGLSKCNNRMISIQEYICSKNFKKRNNSVYRIVFIGGCFPVQHHIKYEDIFLSKIKRLAETEHNIELQIDILRYERFADVLEKIKKINRDKQWNLLVFSIRPEPLFRLIKFYYKFVNNKGKRKSSFNIPPLKEVSPEKYDFLLLGRKFNHNQKIQESLIHQFLVEVNYFLGKLIGNKSFAIRKYIELMKEVKEYCEGQNIELMFLGPNLRSRTKQEPGFCKELDKETRNTFPEILYIDGLFEEYEREAIFYENGIHVNKLYHQLVADNIYKTLKNKLISTIEQAAD